MSNGFPPLTLTFVGRNGPHPIATQFAGNIPARVDAFDLVERAVLKALCVDVLRAIEDHENPRLLMTLSADVQAGQ